jgi:hypothetical protein
MRKTRVYLSEEDLRALHRSAAAQHRTVASLVRDAVRRTYAIQASGGPVAVWDGEPRRVSVDHDRIYDER